MSKRLYIAGCGGFGRELYSFAERHPDHGKKWDLCGFLDDFRTEVAVPHSAKVVGRIADFRPTADDLVICGIGIPSVRKTCISALKAKRAAFLSFIHPTATIGRNVRLGEGVVLLVNVNLTCDITVGDHTTFLSMSGAGHDAKIGSFCQISSLCDIMGGASLGDGVLMGSGSRILPNVSVGDGSTVGAGSVVVSNVESRFTVFGVPARPLSRAT